MVVRIVQAVERGSPGMNKSAIKKMEDSLTHSKDHICKLVEVEFGDGSSDFGEVGYECEICYKVIEPQVVRDILEQ